MGPPKVWWLEDFWKRSQKVPNLEVPFLQVKSSRLKSANEWTWGTYLDLENHWLQNHSRKSDIVMHLFFVSLIFFITQWMYFGASGVCVCVCQRPSLLSQQFGRIFCLKWKIAHHAQTNWNHLTWTWTWHIFLKDLRTYTLIRPLYKAFLGGGSKYLLFSP